MGKTYLEMTDDLYEYCSDNWLRESPELKALRQETAGLEMAQMQISPDQGQFMAFLVKMINAQKILEVGTFTGYSALAMAQATDDKTRIICCDLSEEWTSIAKRHWEQAAMNHKMDLRLAPALDTLKTLEKTELNTIDFAFIDADKSNYDAYFESCLSLVKSGGIVAIDNVFWGGWVADDSQNDDDTLAIRALNKKLKSDDRIDLSIVPIGDGLTLARKK